MDLLPLLQQYARIAFLMAKPQDLPAGMPQLKTGVVLCLVSYVIAVSSISGVGKAVMQAVVEIGLIALLFWVGLSIVNRSARFAQAFGGLCGAFTVLHIVAIPILMLRTGGELTAVEAFSQLFLLVWSLSILGHVIRHTFETNIPVSIGVAFVFYLLLETILSAVAPTSVAQAALLQVSWAWVV